MLVQEAYGSGEEPFVKSTPSRSSFHKREYFALNAPAYEYDPYKLATDKWYQRGALNTTVAGANGVKIPAKYGGENTCKPFSSQVYKLYTPVSADNATCLFDDIRLYTKDPGVKGCQLSTDGRWYNRYVRKTDAQLDVVDTTTTGVTQKAAQPWGMTCSQQINAANTTNSNAYPQYKLFGTPCAATGATCNAADTSLYSVDPGKSEATCTDIINGLYYRKFNKRSDADIDKLTTQGGLTVSPAESGGGTCSDLIGSKTTNLTAYPASKVVGSGTSSPSYCAPEPAQCKLGDADVYTTDPGKSTTTCGTTPQPDGRFYRPFGKRADIETLQTKKPLYGGQTCTQIVGPTTTTYPTSKIVNYSSGTASPSYCSPEAAQCYDPIADNDEKYYQFGAISSGSGLIARDCQIQINPSPTIMQTPTEGMRLVQIVTKLNEASGSGKTCTQVYAENNVKSAGIYDYVLHPEDNGPYDNDQDAYRDYLFIVDPSLAYSQY